jgi:replication factor C subunit 3/5
MRRPHPLQLLPLLPAPLEQPRIALERQRRKKEVSRMRPRHLYVPLFWRGSLILVPVLCRPPHGPCLSSDNLPWVEKYRPSALDELISHQDIITTIGKLIDSNALPHLLFYGPYVNITQQTAAAHATTRIALPDADAQLCCLCPCCVVSPGTGKTSTILAVARKVNGPNYKQMVLELNASDDRGIDVVREQIKDFASSRKLFSHGLKLVILDEADAMTRVAQFALRRVIEKYTKSTRFCILANQVNRIIPALQSRCTRFRFGPLELEQVQSRMEFVIKQEKSVNSRGWKCAEEIGRAVGALS